MELRTLKSDDLEKVLDLFCECFIEDHYYQQMFRGCEDPTAAMRTAFRGSIAFCLEAGIGIGVVDEDKLIGFALLFNYKDTKNMQEAEFNCIFGAREGEKLPYYESLHHEILNLPGDVLYLLSIAIAPDYQKQGLASGIVDHILQVYDAYNIVSDVSNKNSLGIYEKRNFQIHAIDDRYYYIVHERGSPATTVDFSDKLRLLVPSCKTLDQYGIAYCLEREHHFLVGYGKNCSAEIDCFVKQENCVSDGVLVGIEYASLLQYQRVINVSQVCEHTCGDVLFYVHTIDYAEKPLFNQTLADMVKTRSTEWSLIPDVFVSIPVQYSDAKKLELTCADEASQSLLKYMDFRTHYEAGVPSTLNWVDDLASFKKRIRRYYLGKVKIQISTEISFNNYSNIGNAIGPGAFIDIYISIDKESKCAVLTWYSLSSPFLVSHLFDNIVRNQVMIVENGSCINFFDYIKGRFGLIKRGTPKIFSVFPCSKSRLTNNQLASLLVGETIYSEGENFGEIIDEDILAIVQSEYGMGQYDRAFVCAFSNTILQFSENFSGSILDRLCEESITLFYIELILYEEAAIHIADREIINLFTSGDTDDPVAFLSKVDAIYDSYSKTIDFWDIKVNYPTSQKSIAMLRKAFGIKGQLEDMKRNQEQLQTVFNTKSDIIDRKDSKRMDTSLAIISVLAVFSAWIDGYDYIATWNDFLSQGAIHTLQRLLFVAVLLTAGYAVMHLFGNKLSQFLRRRRDRKQR